MLSGTKKYTKYINICFVYSSICLYYILLYIICIREEKKRNERENKKAKTKIAKNVPFVSYASYTCIKEENKLRNWSEAEQEQNKGEKETKKKEGRKNKKRKKGGGKKYPQKK